jgi:hypothetical protein
MVFLSMDQLGICAIDFNVPSTSAGRQHYLRPGQGFCMYSVCACMLVQRSADGTDNAANDGTPVSYTKVGTKLVCCCPSCIHSDSWTLTAPVRNGSAGVSLADVKSHIVMQAWQAAQSAGLLTNP